MSRLVAGDADGGGGGGIVHAFAQPDHIGLGIEVVGQIAADPLDPDTVDAVGAEHPLGGLGAGDLAAGELLGVLFEGGIDIVAGPHGKDCTDEHQQQTAAAIAVAGGVVVIGHGEPP